LPHRGINKLGHVTGEAESGAYGSNNWHTFLYINGKMSTFTGKGTWTDGLAININDEIAGYDGPKSDGNYHAAVFINGQTFDLNDLVPADPTVFLSIAFAINDSGQMLVEGYKYSVNGRQGHTFLLTPLN
jgi:hypothetical protein